MGHRRLEAHGAVDPATAWERYAVVDAWTGWSPVIARVQADRERIARGVRGTVHARGGLRVPFTVTAVDEPARTWSWRVHLGPVPMTLHHTVTAHDGGTATVLVLAGPTPLLLAYAPWAAWALRRLVRP